MKLLRIVGSASSGPLPIDGQWVKDMDVEFGNGRGYLTATRHRSEAMRFADAGEALAYWQRTSKVRPLRPDGKPNRPLTAYTVEVVDD